VLDRWPLCAFRRAPSMKGMGHEDAFLPPQLIARCRFGKETFVGT
jgi:hypothetical protein